MWLNETDLELPPAFKVWCGGPLGEGCGWQSRKVRGGAYVIGVNYPIDSVYYTYDAMRCPQCNARYHRLVDRESIERRFRYVIEQRGYGLKREGDPFPCTCSVYPCCQVIGKIYLSTMPTMGDTVFVSDENWYRAIAKVRCNGCYAVGKVAWIEKAHERDLYRQDWYTHYNEKERWAHLDD